MSDLHVSPVTKRSCLLGNSTASRITQASSPVQDFPIGEDKKHITASHCNLADPCGWDHRIMELGTDSNDDEVIKFQFFLLKTGCRVAALDEMVMRSEEPRSVSTMSRKHDTKVLSP